MDRHYELSEAISGPPRSVHRDYFVAPLLTRNKTVRDHRNITRSLGGSRCPPVGGTSGGDVGPGFRRDSGLGTVSSSGSAAGRCRTSKKLGHGTAGLLLLSLRAKRSNLDAEDSATTGLPRRLPAPRMTDVEREFHPGGRPPGRCRTRSDHQSFLSQASRSGH